MPEEDELRRRGKRAESEGELRHALELYRTAVQAGHDREAGGPDSALLLRIHDLHGRLGEPDASRRALGRALEAAEEGRGDPDSVLEAARARLADEPDQPICLHAAWLLHRLDRTDEALDLLREVWEKRTGRRLPAGEIEAAAHRIDPRVDMSDWTPEWPAVGNDAGAPAGAVRSVAVDEDPGDGEPFARGGGEAEATAVRREDGPGRGREDARAAGGAPARDGAVQDDPEKKAPPRDSAAHDGVPGETVPDDEDDLRRGLRILEELLELDPSDVGLRRRRVLYARRLGDRALLEDALVDLADALAEAGARRGAHLLYAHVVERLNPDHGRAVTGLRREEDRLGESDRADAVPPPAEPALEGRENGGGAAPEAAGTVARANGGGNPDAPDPDAEFRKRLSEGLDRARRELERLRAAGRSSLAPEESATVPWRAHRELGRYLLLRDRPEEAERHLAAARERAPEAGPEGRDLLYLHGIALRRAGRREEALRGFRRLADLDPGFATAREALSR